MRKIAIILCLALVLTVLPGCAAESPAQIAATTLPVYEFTRELCAERALCLSTPHRPARRYPGTRAAARLGGNESGTTEV